MKAGILLTGRDRGSFARLGNVYWRNITKGREVKKFMKHVVGPELEALVELREGIVKQYGKDGTLGPDVGNWEEGKVALQALIDQEVNLAKAPELNDQDLATTEGFSILDLEIFEEIGFLPKEA